MALKEVGGSLKLGGHKPEAIDGEFIEQIWPFADLGTIIACLLTFHFGLWVLK
jgi:hypothetical protein